MMKTILSIGVIGLMTLSIVGCSGGDDGGDPSKAPRVEEVKRPEGWKPPEQAMAEKHAAAREKRKTDSEGESEGGQ